MKKETILKNLTNGTIAMATLADKGAYLLCIVSKATSYFVPLLKKDGLGSAYLDPDKYDDAQYEQLSSLLEVFNSEKIFYTGKYTPKYKKEPAYIKEIISFAKPAGINSTLPKGIKETLEKEGFLVNINLSTTSPYTPRDYGSQVEDNPDFKMQFEAEMNKLKKAKVSYENLPTDIKINYESVMSGAKDGIIFVGPTGTGKTWLTMALACQAGAHREDIQITPDTQVEDLIGKYVADDRPNTDSNWRFEEGPLLKAFYLGYVISIQEINYGIAGVNSCLNRYLDGTLQIEENGKIYHRHPNFVAYLTMNAGYEGTEPLNMALKNRFSVVQVPAWTENKYVEVLTNHSELLGHKLPEAFFKELLKFTATVEHTAAGSGWHENVKFSIRNAQRFLDSILLKPRTLAEFSSAMYSEYINLLSCDNDNSVKLEEYKKEEFVVNGIKKLYELYDFSEVTEAKSLADDLSGLFIPEEEEDDETDEEKSKRTKAFAKLGERFGLDD